jgi:hypothetical protein
VTVEKFPATVTVYEQWLSPPAARTLPSGWATGATKCYDSVHTSISSAKNVYRQRFCRGKIRLRDLEPACNVRSKRVLPSQLHVCG